MTIDLTTEIDDAFLALLHHVIFELTDEQAAALMADDEPITDHDTIHGPRTVEPGP